VYANELTQEALKREFRYVFSENKYPGIPEIDLVGIDSKPFTVGDITVQPIQVWHLKMPVFAFRFNKFTYVTDANKIDNAEKEKIKGTEILVLNALRQSQHISHFNLQEAISMAQELEVEKAYFTHISHQMGRHEEVQAQLPENIFIAYDGLIMNV
jgi:phosphoribosyl 1,2-cyclic phosphate phosphodiesterase